MKLEAIIKTAPSEETFTTLDLLCCPSVSSLGVSLLERRVNIHQAENKLGVSLTLMNVRKNTALGDGYVSEKLIKFLVVSDSKLEMTWDDTGFLVITGSVSGQFKDFSS